MPAEEQKPVKNCAPRGLFLLPRVDSIALSIEFATTVGTGVKNARMLQWLCRERKRHSKTVFTACRAGL